MTIVSQDTLASAKTLVSVAASLAATAVLFRSVTHDLVPDAVYEFFLYRARKLSDRLSSLLTVVIDDFDGLTPNHLFETANVYLGSTLSPRASRIKVNKPPKENQLAVTLDINQELFDFYEGVKLKWVLVSSRSDQNSVSTKKGSQQGSGLDRSESRRFELSFHKKHRNMVLTSYLPFIVQHSNKLREEKKTVRLHTVDYNGTDYWSCIHLNHPATFDTLAMDAETKKTLLDDLDRFIAGKDYYRRIGKAWKRGYLLHGPPGTGKSSLVAALANYLKFDIYDLDLKEVQCNSDLRRLLIGTGNRSILVIEDIDCSIDLSNREADSSEAKYNEEEKITLSALLNFIDGLWSSCGDERIVVCTTNHKDRLDAALLRPGRMDLHIHMSFCSFNGFKTLAANYLGIQMHPRFKDIEELLYKVNATPAEVAGELMKSNNADIALEGLIKFLQRKQHGTSS